MDKFVCQDSPTSKTGSGCDGWGCKEQPPLARFTGSTGGSNFRLSCLCSTGTDHVGKATEGTPTATHSRHLDLLKIPRLPVPLIAVPRRGVCVFWCCLVLDVLKWPAQTPAHLDCLVEGFGCPGRMERSLTAPCVLSVDSRNGCEAGERQ